jgi:CheY-like chemotaxis protein
MACHHILVIEDERDLRETLKEFLELSGFKVATAGNGREGLRQLGETGHPCLILLDLMMPVMNGWQFLEEIKKDRQHALASIPVLVLSAVANAADILQRFGCQTMTKPVDINQLVALARDHCECCC